MPRSFAVTPWLLVVALLTAAPPARAQEFSAEDLAAIERIFGDYLDNALDLCVAGTLPDAPTFEARATDWGWPPFQTLGAWRVSTVPPGDSVIISFGFQAEPITDAPIAGTAFTCSLLMPDMLASMLRGHLYDKFHTGEGVGIFRLDGGELRELRGDVWPEGGVQQLFAETPPDQRLVLLTPENPDTGVAVRVTVMHGAQ